MSPQEEFHAKLSGKGEIYFTPAFFQEVKEIQQQAVEEALRSPELMKILQEPVPLYWKDIRDYDLSEERKNFRINDFPDEGDIVFVISYTGKAEIKFDSPNADSFDLETYKRLKHTYTDIYLTNEAQEDATIRILFGRGDWDFVEKLPKIDLQGTIRNDYLDQLTDPDKIGQIIRDSHIVPHADIACEKILLSGTRRLDQWRSDEDYTFMAPGMILLHGTKKLSDWRHPSDLALFHGGQIFAHSVEVDKLSVMTHILSGATWTDNSPAAGSVAWSGAKVTYNGHTYTIADGSTNQAYIWWDFSLSTTTFQTSNVKPALTDDDFIVCYNDAGTHELVWNATLIEGRTLRTGTITADEINVPGLDGAGDIVIEDGAVTAPKINVDLLSAIAANVGTLTAGLIQSTDGFTQLDLTNGFMSVSDGVYTRFKAGKLDGDYGLTLKDSDGNVTASLGRLVRALTKDVVAIGWGGNNVNITSDGWADLANMTLGPITLPKGTVMLIAKNMVKVASKTGAAAKFTSMLAVRINTTDYAEVDMTTHFLDRQDSLITVYPRNLDAGTYTFKARWKAAADINTVTFTSLARSLIYLYWERP